MTLNLMQQSRLHSPNEQSHHHHGSSKSFDIIGTTSIAEDLAMSDASSDKLTVQVNVQITPDALQAIVANAKLLAAKDADGIYRVDTADQVSIMISRFLDEKDFDKFVLDLKNYTPKVE
jgi:hypothetical protein